MVVCGIGAAGIAYTKMLLTLSVLNIIGVDREGAIVHVFIGSRVIDYVLEGSLKGKAVIIVSRHVEEISARIHDELGRGTTFFHGKGGYSYDELAINYCVIGCSEMNRLKNLVHTIDREAIVIVNDVFKVFGEGFSPIQERG